MKNLLKTTRTIAVLSAAMLMASAAHAATTLFVGTNGVSANSNWSTAANFIDASTKNPETPANNAADFNWFTAAAAPGIVTVNVDGGYGTPGSGVPQAWSMIFGQTNGYHTVFIQPGITLEMIAANGTIGGGGLMICPANTNSGGNTGGNVVGTGTYTNYTTFTGSGGTLLVNGQLRVEAQSSAVNNHYTIMDMSGLGTFVITNTSGGTPARFLLTGGTTRSQGIIYLAQTNIVTPRGDIQIGYLNTSSNSLPIGLYLGMTNLLLTDPTLGNGNVLNLAIQGCTNGFMKFNPAFVGGATKPTAFLSGAGGSMANVNIANASNAFVSSYGIADFTGGTVTWNIGTLKMGQAGAGATNNGTGVLTFDDGTVTVATATVGSQTLSAGGVGTGVINVGSNGTFQATSSITLAATTGTVTPGNSGSINVNGGKLIANNISVGAGGTGTIALSNATFTVNGTAGNPGVPITSVSMTNSTLNFATAINSTNLVASSLTTSGGNTINITAVPPLNTTPTVIKLIAYSGSIGGSGYDFTLGTLPPLCAGSLSNDTANSSVDLVLTSGPLGLTWDGDASPNWDTTETNWLAAGPSFYADGDYVSFADGAATGNVNLTATFLPGGVTVTNNSLAYSFTGGGSISGSIGLLKTGTGTLTIDNSGNNSYSGVTTISNGTLKIGNSDANGNVPGAILDNGALVLARNDGGSFANTISGTGSVTYSGGSTLQLTGGNSFSGNLAINNNSTLQLGSAAAAGTATGGLTVASGSTLDVNGFGVTKSITVSGTGVSGIGALTDNGGGVYDSGSGLATNVTLAGDTAFDFPTRWDLGQSGNGSVLSTGGHAYNLTMNSSGNAYHEWRNLAVDAALANINVTAGTLGIIGSTTLGNPAATITVDSGANITFYNATANVNVNKTWDFQNGVTVQNGGGATVLNGPMTIEAGATIFNVGGTSLTLSNVLSGSGILYGNGGNSPLILWGNSPSFTGGVQLLTGTLTLNGLIGSGISAIGAGTAISGTGTANGLIDISGALLPGGAGTAGTLNAAGGLTLESGATLTMDLNPATTVGGGVNDLITVTGDLAGNGNPITINPVGGTLGNSYTLLTYTGNATSFFSGASTASASRYVFTLTNVTTTTPKQVNLLVTGSGGGPASLVWDNNSGNASWDTQSSQNWSNQTTHVANDLFFAADSVTFDDSITNAASAMTTISIPSAVNPNIVTNNSTTNYTLTGAGKISGGASIVKLGTSTLTIGTTNDYTGTTKVLGGTILQGTNNALGSATGTLIITNSATVDLGGFTIDAKPVLVSGTGVNANGAIFNSGSPVYDDGHALTSVTLSGDATFGQGGNRWDLGNSTGGTLSTGGHAYNVSFTGNSGSYGEWDALTIDPALANISILAGQLGLKGMTSLGNPASTLTIFSGASVTFWGGSGYAKNVDVKSGGTLVVRLDGPNFDFGMTLEGGSTFVSINNAKYFTQPVSMTGLVNFLIGNGSCTFSNVISGPGGFYVNNYDSNPLIFTAANTYSGPTLLSNSGSGLVLALVGNGSISSSTNIGLTSGTVLDVSGRSDHTLTLTSVQTMEGSGTVIGNLTANSGATLEPGFSGTGTLTVTNTATLNGVTAFEIGGGANNLLTATNIQYGGTLSLSFTAGTLAAGNSFKLFNAGHYSGSFGSIVPSTPGAGMTWDTSQLTVSGTIRVSAPPQFSSIAVSGTTLTLAGSGGTSNGSYHVLTSTNAGARLNTWTTLGSSNFTASGTFNFTNSVNPTDRERFYILVEP
jgi:autotransporter-associated beta strand protein